MTEPTLRFRWRRPSKNAAIMAGCSIAAATAVVAGMLVVGAGSTEATHEEASASARQSHASLGRTQDRRADTFADTVGALAAGQALSPRVTALIPVIDGVLNRKIIAQLIANRAALDKSVASVATSSSIDMTTGTRVAWWWGVVDIELPVVAPTATTAELVSYTAVASGRDDDTRKVLAKETAKLNRVAKDIDAVNASVDDLAGSAVASAKAVVKAAPSATQATRRAAIRAAHKVAGADDKFVALVIYVAAAKAVRASHIHVEALKADAAAEAKAKAEAKAAAKAAAEAAKAKAAAEKKAAEDAETKRLADEAAAAEAKRLADEAAAANPTPTPTPTPVPSPTPTPQGTDGPVTETPPVVPG